jgi:hypothetical protein
MDWIDLAQNRDKWQTLVNKVTSNSIKCRVFLDYLRNYQLLRDSAARSWLVSHGKLLNILMPA